MRYRFVVKNKEDFFQMCTNIIFCCILFMRKRLLEHTFFCFCFCFTFCEYVVAVGVAHLVERLTSQSMSHEFDHRRIIPLFH